MNSFVNLYWGKSVFDPATKDRAGGKPRILIMDGFNTHESLDVLTFCFENNIILCRQPSHATHKTQLCDVGVFSPLKTSGLDGQRQGCTLSTLEKFLRRKCLIILVLPRL
jgi:hypothetical protein